MYAIRKDGLGWRSVNGEDDILTNEVLGDTIPGNYQKWDGSAWITDIEALRDAKLAELAAYRYDREVGGITIDGKSIATDRDTQSLITSTLKGLSLKPEGSTVKWRGTDGIWILVDQKTLTDIGMSVFDYVEACWNNQEAHEIAIKALTTAEEIEAYDFTTGWPGQY